MLSLPQLLRFCLEILNAHDDLRAIHDVGPVKLSEKVLNQNGFNCNVFNSAYSFVAFKACFQTHEIKIS